MGKEKYPRTYHLPFSEGVNSDDKVKKDLSSFQGEEVVVSEKLDGENTTLYNNFMHARSISSPTNFTRNWVAKMHSILKFYIPENVRLVGENLWAEHAIYYPNYYLEGYFYLFSVFENRKGVDFCLSYEEVVEYSIILDLPMPKVFYRGIFEEEKIKNIAKNLNTKNVEGFVVRKVREFKAEHFSDCVLKWVRKNHVQSNSEHWLRNAKQNGKLKKEVKPYYMRADVPHS